MPEISKKITLGVNEVLHYVEPSLQSAISNITEEQMETDIVDVFAEFQKEESCDSVRCSKIWSHMGLGKSRNYISIP